MFSPVDFQREMNRFRHQMNHIFRDFDRTFAAESDPFMAMHWDQPVNLLTQDETKNRPEQKESLTTEQKAAATGSNQMAVESTAPAATTSTGAPNGDLTATAPTNTAVAQQSQRPNDRWGWLSSGAGWPGVLSLSMVPPRPSFDAVSIPRMDVVEKDDHFEVKCDLPGMAKEEVQVSVSPNGVLSIKAEHSENHEQKDEKAKYHRVERSYGKYSRSMQLPDTVDADAVKAKHDNGVLQLTLPKKQKAEPKAAKKVAIH